MQHFLIFLGRYPVILNAVKEKGWKLVGATNEDLNGKNCPNSELPVCNIHWVDVANINERFSKIAPWQRFNHFPGKRRAPTNFPRCFCWVGGDALCLS